MSKTPTTESDLTRRRSRAHAECVDFVQEQVLPFRRSRTSFEDGDDQTRPWMVAGPPSDVVQAADLAVAVQMRGQSVLVRHLDDDTVHRICFTPSSVVEPWDILVSGDDAEIESRE